MTEKAITYQPIGIIHSLHKTVDGMPIQPSAANGLQGEIHIFPEFADGLKDLDGFSHIILVYDFHQSREFTLQPQPFLDDQVRGVFATRAPRRPNAIGLSVVRLIEVSGHILRVENIDILDQTPLLDIKPYVSRFDAVENERSGWLAERLAGAGNQRADHRFE